MYTSKMMTKKTYYTTQEVMKLLDISRPTVYIMIADGRLDAVKMGKYSKWMIDPLSIPTFIRNANSLQDK